VEKRQKPFMPDLAREIAGGLSTKMGDSHAS
jgi:hypothetical protein